MNQFPPPSFYGEPEHPDQPSQPSQTSQPSPTGSYPPPPSGYQGSSGYQGAPPPSHLASQLGATGRTAHQQSRGRGRFVLGVAALALLIGGGVGAGAMLVANPSNGTSHAPSAALTTIPVVDQGRAEAAPGSVQQVAETVLPSVVRIDVAAAAGSGSGSGIVLSPDGKILTNDHVVSLAGQINPDQAQIRVSFSDGTRAEAKVLGADPLTDTAVIQATGVSDLTPATIGKSANLSVGQDVVAIGSPFGLDATVTSGIVSALNRPVSVGNDGQGNSATYPAIQTDASINPGNSGGPLVDMTGSVIGINSSIRGSSSALGGEAGSIGLGFAIPIDEVMPIVEQLVAGETATHARLGVSVGNADTQSIKDPIGARLETVSQGSTAQKAGLQPGDVITKIDERQITSADALVATVRAYRPGDEVTVTYSRGGQQQTTSLTLDSDATQS